MNVKSPPHVCALLFDRAMAPAVVLSMVPPLMANVPLPTALALFTFNCPAESVVPPENVFAPDKVSVPLRLLLRHIRFHHRR